MEFIVSDNFYQRSRNDLLTRQHYDIQSFGLIILLIGEIGNSMNSSKTIFIDRKIQNDLAECYECQQQALIIHESIMNFQTNSENGTVLSKNSPEMKSQMLKLLIGDLLIAKSIKQIAELQHIAEMRQ
jgi:hypothetical protein